MGMRSDAYAIMLFCGEAELRNNHRQTAGSGICANQMTRDMGRDCFRNKRLPNVRFLTLS